jgi:uncharacterized membrane protein
LWDTHRVFFRYIPVGNARISWANLLVLLWVTLIPAIAALLGSHWEEPVALILYALNLLLAVASYWLLWRYVSTPGYVHGEALAAASRLHLDQYAGLSVLGYALAMAAAFLSPLVSLVLIFLTTTLARAISRRVLASTATPQSGIAAHLPSQDTNPADLE